MLQITSAELDGECLALSEHPLLVGFRENGPALGDGWLPTAQYCVSTLFGEAASVPLTAIYGAALGALAEMMMSDEPNLEAALRIRLLLGFADSIYEQVISATIDVEFGGLETDGEAD